MKKVLLLLVCFLALGWQSATANNYEFDHDSFEPLFEQAVEIDYDQVQNMLKNDIDAGLVMTGPNRQASIQLWAAIAGVCELVTGLVFIPVHRIILGTSTGTIIGYILTCGGCGIVTLVDTIILLVHAQDERYVESQRFIMW